MRALFMRLSALTKSPVFPWALAFIVSAMMVPQRGGDNTYARLATMRAMLERHTFMLDDYKAWSDDWSLSPNGHYYSDKAPGSAFFGLPFFAITDLPLLAQAPTEPNGLHRAPSTASYLFLLFCVQLLPFALLILLLSEELLATGTSLAAVNFFALAAFFGNTAAIYMAAYSGHPLAAWFFLSAFVCFRRKNMVLAGFFIASSVLTDYATIMTLPIFLIATLYRDRSAKAIGQVVLGAFPIMILWAWYHGSAFGSPLHMAAGYANPAGMRYDPHLPNEGARAIIALVPYPEFVWKLLFGSERGLLFTQAWILVLGAALAWHKKWRFEWLVVLGAFGALLWLNSSILVWSAGRAAGPRYCCLIFPTFAYLAALSWDDLSKPVRALMCVGLLEALVYRAFLYPFGERAPEENLWVYYAHRYRDAFKEGYGNQMIYRLTLFSLCMLVAFVYLKVRARSRLPNAALLERKAVL